MATISKQDEIKLPFVTINMLNLKGHADTLENIPELVIKIAYRVTNSDKEPNSKDSEYEFGLSFSDVEPIPKHAEYIALDYIKYAIEYHLYALTHKFVSNIDNRTIQCETGIIQMSRIMDIIRSDRDPAPLKLEYTKNNQPMLQFGIGRSIMAQIVPNEVDVQLVSADKNNLFGIFYRPDDEPMVTGKIDIFGKNYRIYLWRIYNNKEFNLHVLKELLAHEVGHILYQNEKLINALGGYGAVIIHQNNTDRLLKLQS